MAYSFVTNLGTSSATSSGTRSLTVGATVPVGDIVVVRCYGSKSSNQPITACSDSAGNTYTALPSSGNFDEIWYTLVTSQLTSGSSTITVTHSGMSEIALTADQFTGVPATLTLETTPATTSGTGTSASISITPTNGADLIVAALRIEGGNSDTFTEDSDSDGGDTWHSLTKLSTPSSSSCVRGAYKILTSSVALTYDPSWSGFARNWGATIVGFKGIVPVSDAFPTRSRRRRVVYR